MTKNIILASITAVILSGCGTISGRFLSQDGTVRAQAMMDFENSTTLEKNRIVDLLVKKIDDPDTITRQSAAASLGNLGGQARTAVGKLSVNFNNPDVVFRDRVREALLKIDSSAVVAEYVKNLDDSSEAVRQSAAINLGDLGLPSQEAVDKLSDKFNSSDASFRRVVREALVKIDAKAAVMAYVNNFIASDGRDRDSLLALAEMGTTAETAVPHLLAILPKLADQTTSILVLQTALGVSPAKTVEALIELTNPRTGDGYVPTVEVNDIILPVLIKSALEYSPKTSPAYLALVKLGQPATSALLKGFKSETGNNKIKYAALLAGLNVQGDQEWQEYQAKIKDEEEKAAADAVSRRSKGEIISKQLTKALELLHIDAFVSVDENGAYSVTLDDVDSNHATASYWAGGFGYGFANYCRELNTLPFGGKCMYVKWGGAEVLPKEKIRQITLGLYEFRRRERQEDAYGNLISPKGGDKRRIKTCIVTRGGADRFNWDRINISNVDSGSLDWDAPSELKENYKAQAAAATDCADDSGQWEYWW